MEPRRSTMGGPLPASFIVCVVPVLPVSTRGGRFWLAACRGCEEVVGGARGGLTGFVCLFVCKFTDSGSGRSVALLRGEPALPEALGPKGRQTRPLSCAGYRLLPCVGRQGNSLFRAPAGRRMADSAGHVPLLSSAFAWLLCGSEDLGPGSSVWSPIAQLLSHGCLTLNLWLSLCCAKLTSPDVPNRG